MIIRSFRDVEGELRRLLEAVENLKRLQSNQSDGLSQAAIIALVKQYSQRTAITQTTNNTGLTASDVDSTMSGGEVIHNLFHHFLNSLQSTNVYIPGELGLSTKEEAQNVTNYWRILRQTANSLTLAYDDTSSGDSFAVIFTAGALPEDGTIVFLGTLGNLIFRLKQIYTADFSVLANGPNPGDILSAVDTDGNVEWISPAAGVGSIANANASATLTLNTTFTDITGVTLTLTANGVYEVTGVFVFSQSVNDTECQGQVVHDDSGAFVALTGIVRSSKDSSATIINTCTKTWPLTITSQPTVVKLQAKKTGGTGTSFTDITNTSLTIKRIS